MTTCESNLPRPVLWDDVPAAIRLRVIKGEMPYTWGSEYGSVPADEIELLTKWIVVDHEGTEPLACEVRYRIRVDEIQGLETTVRLRLISARRRGAQILATFQVDQVSAAPAVVAYGPGGDYVRTWPAGSRLDRTG